VCGGYYEEEMMEDMKFTTAGDMMREYYGPSAQFNSMPVFGKAAVICEIENIECNLDPVEYCIHFASVKEEERFTIAWLQYLAKKQQRGLNE